MKTYRMNADHPIKFTIGYVGERQVSDIVFMFNAWQSRYGEGTIALLIQRKGDTVPYPVILDVEDGKATWHISNVDTAVLGEGEAQLLYTVDGALKKSSVFAFDVVRSLDEEGDVPEPYDSLIEQVTEKVGTVTANAEKAEEMAISASESASVATTKASEARESEANALQSAQYAFGSAENASESESNARVSATNAHTSETNANTSEVNARTSATNAHTSEVNAHTSEENASASATEAEGYMNQAREYAESARPISYRDEDSGNIVIYRTYGGE